MSLRTSPQTGVAIRSLLCGAIPLLAIRFPCTGDPTEALKKSQRLGYGLPRRFAPRNDSAGQNPVITMFMLTKTDSHNPNKTCRDIGARKRYDDKCETDPIWIQFKNDRISTHTD